MLCGPIAQSVEQRPLKPRVPGSIPGRLTNIDKHILFRDFNFTPIVCYLSIQVLLLLYDNFNALVFNNLQMVTIINNPGLKFYDYFNSKKAFSPETAIIVPDKIWKGIAGLNPENTKFKKYFPFIKKSGNKYWFSKKIANEVTKYNFTVVAPIALLLSIIGIGIIIYVIFSLI